MPPPRTKTPLAHRSSPRGQAWGNTLTHAYRPIPDKMASFLDNMLRLVREPLGSNKTYTMDPDDEKRALGKRLAKLSTQFGKLCCIQCKKPTRLEPSADDSGSVCKDCGDRKSVV